MNILAIEPLGATGHKKLNAYYLKILSEIGTITLATFNDSHPHVNVTGRIDIPDTLKKSNSRIGTRINQIKALNYILKNTDVYMYDIVFFLTYEIISLGWVWPKNINTFVFEHNNIDSTLNSFIKTLFYRKLPGQVTHLTYMNYISRFIEKKFHKKTICIAHPYFREAISPNDTLIPPRRPANAKKFIFAPSNGNDPTVIEELKAYATQSNTLYLTAKGPKHAHGRSFKICPHFDDYETQMQHCDFVFMAGRYNYRVSGIAFETLSYGKPLILIDSLFARELKKVYPHSVFIINQIPQIDRLSYDPDKIAAEHQQFMVNHSYETIKNELKKTLVLA